MASGTASRAMAMPSASAALRTATASSARPGTLRSRSGRAARTRGAVPNASSRPAASAPASEFGPRPDRRISSSSRSSTASRPARRKRARKPAAARGLPDRGLAPPDRCSGPAAPACRTGGVRGIPVRVDRAGSCRSSPVQPARSRFSARARQCAISRPYSVAVEDAVDVEQGGQLKADQADRRVVALRHALGDGLPAGGVQGERNARRDCTRRDRRCRAQRTVAVVAGRKIRWRSSSRPSASCRQGRRRWR